MGGLLAHEMMHGWLYLQGKPWERERSVEEGICQVMYYKWLQWFSSRGYNSSHKTNEQVQHTRMLKEYLAQEIECWNDEVYGQGFINAMRAIEIFGFKTTVDHIVKDGTLPVVPPVAPVVMGKKKKTTTTTELTRKKTTCALITELLWKATSNTTKSLWKATAATITNLLWKVTAACETPRFVTMEGHRHHQYHQGQSHNNLHVPMAASPTLLLVFIGILIEHK
ncbi:putative protein DA1 [Rosa chinensis]|uniref:Protein DA1-like domain-containing protein n=1 Tax=Rosa chinensis TaxID=74649 RepID=A0A2P6QUN0_ROSCH|nr:putative protein DA1 [Rosa chinensis]